VSPVAADLPALRKQLAGGDAVLEKELERYGTPDAIGKAFRERGVRISQGFKPEAFPDKGTDEAKAAWRAANAVPSAAADYVAKIGDGIVIGEADKPTFESFAAHAHSINMPQGTFNEIAKWYNGLADERQAAVEELDGTHRTEVDDSFIKEFGPAEYRANKNNLQAMLSANFDEATTAALLNARGADGRALFNNAAVLKGMFQLARTVNPMSTLVGNAGTGDAKSVDARLAELQALRSKDVTAWMKNEPGRKEERELLELKSRMAPSR